MRSKEMGYWEFVVLVGAVLSLMWWVGISLMSLMLPELGILKDVGLRIMVFKGWFLVWSMFSLVLFVIIRPKFRFDKSKVLVLVLLSSLWGMSMKNEGWLWVMGLWVASFYLLWGWREILEKKRNFQVKRGWIKKTVVAGIVIGTVLSVGIYTISRAINDKRAWWGDYPVIEKIEPTIVFPSNKVVIYGKNFGWKEDKYAKPVLQSNRGIVRTDLWTNEKIIFTIPMGWQGEVRVWVEKHRQWKGERILNKSEEKSLKVLDSNKINADDEREYFNQIDQVSEEVRKLNGW